MRCFVYGTLTDPSTAAAVLDDFSYEGPATLHGLERVDGQYPTLVPGDRTEGRILRTEEVAALDRYEGVERGLYVRVALPADAGDDEVHTYVGDPDALGAPGAWPGDGSLRQRVTDYVADADVRVTPDA